MAKSLITSSLYTHTVTTLFPSPGVSAEICRVTGGVLGIHWSSVVDLGWRPLAVGRNSASCWESCCLEPACSAVWSLGGRCVLLSCSNRGLCQVTSLPQPHIESLGLLQQLSKSTTTARRRRQRRAPTGKGSGSDQLSSTVSQRKVIVL